ncbi:MAG TPA: TIGR00266 family protein [Thermoanaerobaculia bacterium]|nr:TIGR00266 family protein [Thermoanaerobaculia bacterium]
MDIEILHGPGNSAAKVRLGAGETCIAEGGAMIAMSGDMAIQTTTQSAGSGGIMSGLKRMMAGESFFLNHFTAGARGGDLYLAATLAGDMAQYELNNEMLIVQSGSFVAAEPGVGISFGWQGFKTLFAGEKLIWVQLSGSGKVVFNSFGAIYPIDVNGTTIVDTGHIVAFQETLKFSLTKAAKSWVSSILGGEGLVCRFEGRGRVWCQSHNPSSFGHALGRLLRPRQS